MCRHIYQTGNLHTECLARVFLTWHGVVWDQYNHMAVMEPQSNRTFVSKEILQAEAKKPTTALMYVRHKTFFDYPYRLSWPETY